MITKFKESLVQLTGQKDFHPASPDNPKILLAVSGGIDSMCMAHLFARIYYSNFAIATVNFSLRGEESDSDEDLVSEWAAERGVQFFSNTFDTKGYAKSMGISTQMAARDLRYNWFETLMTTHGFDYLAVAHNLNDSVETFFINILRGTGLQGLTGIRKKNGTTIRPLLGFSRREIAEFTKKENIPFREDSSNYESHYSRNRIRNMVFPEFEIINQSFLKTVERDMANVEAASDILEDLFKQKRNSLIDDKSGRISIPALLKERRPDYWLFLLLDKYGFNPGQIEQIYDSLQGQPGKEFHSDSCLLLKDRDYLLIYPKGTPMNNPPIAPDIAMFEKPKEFLDSSLDELLELLDDEPVQESEPTPVNSVSVDITVNLECVDVDIVKAGDYRELSFEGTQMRFSIYPKPQGFKFKKERAIRPEFTGDLFVVSSDATVTESTLLIDADLVKFPVSVRKWREGDKFMPLGMSGYKKISDYLTDIKMDKIRKETLLVTLSEDKIVAIPGFRIDERFKISQNTKNILEISLL
jgi:tRNA(Ile)-lysidine synthase